ncbi:Hypothetical Protein SLY_0756 [Strawberry lethal yellows phytoplasma (CPA) str. NZSb11]|uniref:Uncharacterized protein n=1 Tax=Strawberry lethal yellows phytoplasma (CPA) str. NZSb11 TaxID=980422 RepID=R4RMV3_PHYAS|nr:Hypothetical Protein SLY_0756 [Strawberry lethal yellows phytoplasma (CPA) str. NZSb11]
MMEDVFQTLSFNLLFDLKISIIHEYIPFKIGVIE